MAAVVAFMAGWLAGAAPALARLAQLDSSFGHGGIVETGFAGTTSAVLVLPDRSVLVLMTLDGAHDELGLARYLPSGSLDQSFGKRGLVMTTLGDGLAPSRMTLAPGGKILVVGTAFPNAATTVVALLRYRSNGSLDPTFGSNGIVVQTSPSIGREGTSVLVQGDGKILVGGWSQGFMVARYTANGKSLDSTFASGGVAGVPGDLGGCGTSSPDGTDNMALGAGGLIIASGDCGTNGGVGANTEAAVLGFDGGNTPMSGQLDSTFGVDGGIAAPFAPPNFAAGLVRRPDGTLVQLVQVSYGDEGARIGLAGYTASGLPEDSASPQGPRFGSGNGSVNFGLGTHDSIPVGMALAGDGKVLVAGSDEADNGLFALVRRNANGSADASFAPAGVFRVRVGKPGTQLSPAYGAGAMTVQPDGRVIEAGVARDGSKSTVTLVRFGRPPALSALKSSARTISYRDTQAATTTLTVIALEKHGRQTLGSLVHLDHPGRNQLRLPDHLESHKVEPGNYLLEATPVADGLTGATASVRFTLSP